MLPLSWSGLLTQLEQVILRCGSQKIDQCREQVLSLLHEYEANELDFKNYVSYDESSYTKNLVKKIGSDCNIIVMCWAPGQSSAFHAHEGSKCFVKVLAGQLIEQQVAYPKSNSLVSTSDNKIERSLNLNDVSYIDDSIGAHKVLNTQPHSPAITLHIYSPPYTKCRLFDNNQSSQHCISIDKSQVTSVTFHSEFGLATK